MKRQIAWVMSVALLSAALGAGWHATHTGRKQAEAAGRIAFRTPFQDVSGVVVPRLRVTSPPAPEKQTPNPTGSAVALTEDQRGMIQPALDRLAGVEELAIRSGDRELLASVAEERSRLHRAAAGVRNQNVRGQ